MWLRKRKKEEVRLRIVNMQRILLLEQWMRNVEVLARESKWRNILMIPARNCKILVWNIIIIAKILAWNEDQSKGFGSPQGDSLKKFQKENPGKVTEKQLVSGLFKMLGQMGRPLVTRQDSLGGSGIQIPYVSRVRSGRPRENFMTLVKLQPKGMGMAAKLVKKAFNVCDSQPATGRGNKVVKTGPAPGWVQQPLITKREITEEYLERKTTDLDKHDVSFQHMDSSSDTSDDKIVTVPTANGGMRRKHHRPWTLSEVVKLIEGVARYGAGRWSEIKRVSFASYSYRTSVDLKMDNSRKPASIPIPATIFVRVRELAEMQSQVPPNLSVGKFAGHGRSVHETRSGYL